MNEYSVNSGNDLLYSLLAKPAEMTHSDAFNLQLLINEYPQSSVLWMLLAEKNGHEGISRAVPHVKPHLLSKAVQGVYKFPVLSTDQIVFQQHPSIPKSGTTDGSIDVTPHESNSFHAPAAQDVAKIGQEEELSQDEAIVDNEEQPAIAETDLSQNEEDRTNVEDVASLNKEAIEEIANDELQSNDHAENDGGQEDIAAIIVDDTDSSEEITTAEHIDEAPKYFHQEIDDEVFEEIVSIEDINLEQPVSADSTVSAKVEESMEDVMPQPEKKAGDSFFVFEPSPSEDSRTSQIEGEISGQTLLGSGDGQPVSKYHDEKLPYSFLWWLDKTRREHAGLYRPYASQTTPQFSNFTKKEQPQQMPDNLQQQYYENIFAVSPAVADFNTAPNKGHAPVPETKEAKIIERFIQEEPQIKHPNEAKLNNENKAKKSAEDRDELVTETLAKIYSDQMLYHKAISTYKKLMLKFPEKSLYFASQIEQLESKIN